MRTRLAVLLVAAAVASGCSMTVPTPRLHDTKTVSALKDKGELKVHMRTGELYVLSGFRIEAGEILEGPGTHYTILRQPDGAGTHRLRLDEIALIETTETRTAGTLGMLGLGTLTTIWGTASVYCLANPKSCFGSCPTFYLDGDADVPKAEGFSASIARALEARDVDALPDARPHGGHVAVTMRNEAFETHAVRSVRLLAAPRPRGGRVFAGSDGLYYQALRVSPPGACRAPEGDCLAAVAKVDSTDRLSQADAEDLAAREDMFLDFDTPHGRAGVVIGARQSLMTTFLFYQTLAYAGSRAGEVLAAVERGGTEYARRMMAMRETLGGIEVAVADASGGWTPVGVYDEAGPIAGDMVVIPLPERAQGHLRVRLRMSKGNWRLGFVGLAALGAAVTPVSIDPERVDRDGRTDPGALTTLLDPNRHLITLPGDQYRLVFPVPGDPALVELFLESQGYYYEWMRQEWLAEEDPAMVALIVQQPAQALRRLAAPYKAREAQAEQAFWNSRFRR